MRTLVITLLVFLLVGCESGEPVKNAPKVGDQIELPPIVWKIRTEKQMAEIREDSLGPTNHKVRVLGLAGVNQDTGRVEVITGVPRYVDDQVACTLGHEIMHVALGDFHK